MVVTAADEAESEFKMLVSELSRSSSPIIRFDVEIAELVVDSTYD